ncbi:5-(carboxyamino)imidazole ribonucleotide synthase [Litorivivens sp.]|uniref:5-(carboxyamino)imidazole ribonucleotide synthase n=2 Tax=Litorivivens sp. TaxID=2020868 RepID=UPI003563B993
MHIAIFGGGQLARMLALTGLRMGLEFTFIIKQSQADESRAIRQLGRVLTYSPDQESSIASLLTQLGAVDAVTMESEQLPDAVLAQVARHHPLRPSLSAFSICKNRLAERRFLESLGIPIAPYRHLENLAELDHIEQPVYAKSLTEGYDGKGQFYIRDNQQLQHINTQTTANGWIVEHAVIYSQEVSSIAVRALSGEIALYPLTANRVEDGILRMSYAPARRVSEAAKAAIIQHTQTILRALDYVGVLAIEWFVIGDRVIVNEIAPRVHNTGHWTVGAGCTDQFENHLRAISGLPLGSTQSRGYAGIVNLLGTEKPPLATLNSNNTLHWYEKRPAPRRKMGHVTFYNASSTKLRQEMLAFENALTTVSSKASTPGV